MENPGGLARAGSLAVTARHDAFEIAGELCVVVVRRRDRDVVPMIAEVEYQHVEFGQELAPVRVIGVGGKAVAVGDQQPYAVRIARPPHHASARRPPAEPRMSGWVVGISNDNSAKDRDG